MIYFLPIEEDTGMFHLERKWKRSLRRMSVRQIIGIGMAKFGRSFLIVCLCTSGAGLELVGKHDMLSQGSYGHGSLVMSMTSTCDCRSNVGWARASIRIMFGGATSLRSR